MCHLCLNSSHLMSGACGVEMWYMVEKGGQLYIMLFFMSVWLYLQCGGVACE